MQRTILVAIITSLLAPVVLPGQHGSWHGNEAPKSTTPATPEEDPDVTGLQRSIAMQASDAQAAQFQEAVKSTEKAQQQAGELAQSNVQKLARGKLSTQTKILADLLDDAQSDVHTFRRSLNDAQEAGLKKLIKRLEKSDSAVTKESNTISREMEQDAPDRSKIATAISGLTKALTALRENQSRIAKEIGIEPQQP